MHEMYDLIEKIKKADEDTICSIITVVQKRYCEVVSGSDLFCMVLEKNRDANEQIDDIIRHLERMKK